MADDAPPPREQDEDDLDDDGLKAVAKRLRQEGPITVAIMPKTPTKKRPIRKD